MAGVNRVTLVGRLGNDPDLKELDGGNKVATFSLATSESWKDKQGQKQEKTEWHRVVFWGKQAELVKQYCHKGDLVYVEGKLTTRQWEKEGQKHYTTEINGNSVQFLSTKSKEGGNASGGGGNDRTPPPSSDRDAGMTNDDMIL